jgi:hypothetical protein
MTEGVDEEVRSAIEKRVDEHEVRPDVEARSRIEATLGRQPVQLDREDVNEDQPEDEDRDADANEAEDGHAAVDPALGVARGQPSEGDADKRA